MTPAAVRATCAAGVLLASAGGALLAGPPRGGPDVCDGLGGVAASRCERQALMDARCERLDGAARQACERAFFLAHPLICPAAADDACPCALETNVAGVCASEHGAAFAACLRWHGDLRVTWAPPPALYWKAVPNTPPVVAPPALAGDPVQGS
jgi:hypothetical protein